MFNLANEKNTQEAMQEIYNEIQEVKKVFTEDIRNLTINFLALKEKLEEIKEVNKEHIKTNDSLEEAKNRAVELINLFRKFESFKSEIVNSLKEERVEVNNNPVVQVATTLTEDKTGKALYAHCITCNDQRIMENTQEMINEGSKMIVGSCNVCGRKLFKLE